MKNPSMILSNFRRKKFSHGGIHNNDPNVDPVTGLPILIDPVTGMPTKYIEPKAGSGVLKMTSTASGTAPPTVPGVTPPPVSGKLDIAGMNFGAIGNTLGNLGDAAFVDKYGNKTNKEAALTGIVRGAGTGASIGSALGPIGTVVGAGIGGIAGGITSAKRNKEQLAEYNRNKTLEQVGDSKIASQEYRAKMANYDTGTEPVNYFAKGGTAQIQALDKKSKTLKINGKTHEQGGVAIGNAEVERGEIIHGNKVFSNRLKIPGTNRTYAGEAQRLIGQPKFKTLEARLEKGEMLKVDDYRAGSLARNVSSTLAPLNSLFNRQEQGKMSTTDKRKFGAGGDIETTGYNADKIAQNQYSMFSKTREEGADHSGRKVLKRGMKENTPGEITQMQQFLLNNGYYKGKVDGNFGPKTEEAVRAYQKYFNDNAETPMTYTKDGTNTELIGKGGKRIVEDGIVGDQTRSALMYRAPSKVPAAPAPAPVPASPNVEFPMGERRVGYQTSDYTPNNFPDSPMNYQGGLEMLGLATLPFDAAAVGGMAARGVGGAAARNLTANGTNMGLPKVYPKALDVLGNTVPKGATRTGGRTFGPSGYGTRVGYAAGGLMSGAPYAYDENGDPVGPPKPAAEPKIVTFAQDAANNPVSKVGGNNFLTTPPPKAWGQTNLAVAGVQRANDFLNKGKVAVPRPTTIEGFNFKNASNPALNPAPIAPPPIKGWHQDNLAVAGVQRANDVIGQMQKQKPEFFEQFKRGTSADKVVKEKVAGDRVTPNPLFTGKNVMGALEKTAPYIDNITNAILTAKSPKVPVPKYASSARLKTNYNINPQLAEIEKSNMATKRTLIDNTTGGSELRSSLLANSINNIGAKSNLLGQKENMETDLKNKQATMDADTANRNRATQNQYNLNKFGRLNDIQTRVSQNAANVTEDVQQQIIDKKLNQSDQIQLALVMKKYKSTGVLDRMNPNRIVELIKSGRSAEEAIKILDEEKAAKKK